MNRPTDLTEQNLDIERLVHELRVHQAELEVQNEELRRAEIELMASRDRYRLLYEQAPVGYARLDGKGCILDANNTLCQRLGCERKWLVGRPLTSLMSDADADTFYRSLRDVRDGAIHSMCEVGLSRGGDPVLKVRLDSTVTRGDGVEQDQVLTAVVDVTDLRRAEDQARTHDAKAKILLDTTPDGILTLDVEGRIEAVNAATLRMSVSTSTIDSGASPVVPSTSSWPSWPTSTIVKPSSANLRASTWTLVTSGQVASIVRSCRFLALAWTLGATPCAENTTSAPSGTSVSWSTKIAPRLLSPSTTCLLWTISLRT
jgi:PAS domain S-box-containing protein